jgi:hypothetical protein
MKSKPQPQKNAVITAKAGIQHRFTMHSLKKKMDYRLRGNDIFGLNPVFQKSSKF